jgi:hypothetical protein
MHWFMAQARDGYRSTDAPPLTTTTLPREVMELAFGISVNIRAINGAMQALLVNSGMRTMMDAFNAIPVDRITRALERSNQLKYEPFLGPWIEYWSSIFSPYDNGPIVINTINLQDLNVNLPPANGAFHDWNGTMPDWTSATDLDYMLDDIELGLSMLLDFNLGANDLADYQKMVSLWNMVGHMTPSPAAPILKTDYSHWVHQFKLSAFHFRDNKGGGVDTHAYWPDMRGNEDTMVNVNYMGNAPGTDDLYWVGAKGAYGFEADDDDTPGYTAAANDLTSLGSFIQVYPDETNDFKYITKVYTQEDSWQPFAANLDFTAADDVQDYVWRCPWITQHPEAYRAINSEDAYETYRYNMDDPGVQLPIGTFGRAYRKYLISQTNLPFVI